jgi:membrane-bound lytic murein transglycosylase A
MCALRGRLARTALAVLGVAALAGCVPPRAPTTVTPAKPALALTQVSFAELPGWTQDHSAAALGPFLAGCREMATMPPDQPLGGEGEAAKLGGQPQQWRAACTAAAGVPPGDDAAARSFFETYFQPYAVSDASAAPAERQKALLTGYFDPEVRGSRAPGGMFRTPLLGRPADLVTADLGDFVPELKGRSITGRVQNGRLMPYYDRAQIEAGALSRQRLEFLWLTSPIDAFFLQVQGSGRVLLPDGRVVRVTYAGQNGRPYVPIGRVLAERGAIPRDQMSMQAIRAWLEAHPAEAQQVINENPSYVFFREIDDLRPDQGPPGTLGVPLTPERSIAVDRAFLPLGAPVFIATTDPLSGAPLQRLMLAQDLGGAIRGPARADIFFGWGQEAEERAGRMRAEGREYILLPRPVAAVAAASP